MEKGMKGGREEMTGCCCWVLLLVATAGALVLGLCFLSGLP